MSEQDTLATLKAWRRANGLSQERLAARLNVSQAAISRWEAGLDTPSLEVVGRIRSLLDPKADEELAREELLVREQLGLRLLFDVDGSTLLATSRAYSRLYPSFCRMTGRRFVDRLVGETKIVYEDPALHSSVKLGEVAMMSGTTERHMDVLPGEVSLKHNWAMQFRKLGYRMVAEITVELCDPEAPTKLGKIIRVDELQL
jgi:transcriptional regulator with XRE-family HTH domain